MDRGSHRKQKEKLHLKKKPVVRGKLSAQRPVRMAVFKESPSCRELHIRWRNIGHMANPTEIAINIHNLTKTMSLKFIVPVNDNWKVPVLLTPGNNYKIVVEAKIGSTTVGEGKIFHRAVLVESEMDQLIQRARDFLGPNYTKVLVKYFYRNKPAVYFEDIRLFKEGVMEPYVKDENGDQGSVINTQISGLFFSVKVDAKTGLPPLHSPFGNTRINIPVDRLMHTNCEIYFADFYCNHNVHYVTLVITERGSLTDAFCRKNLVNIGMFAPRNPFLFYDRMDDRFYCCTKLWVEVYYTEAIDINRELNEDPRVFFSPVPIIGKGSSNPQGLPKNKACHTCNLYTLHDREEEF